MPELKHALKLKVSLYQPKVRGIVRVVQNQNKHDGARA